MFNPSPCSTYSLFLFFHLTALNIISPYSLSLSLSSFYLSFFFFLYVVNLTPTITILPPDRYLYISFGTNCAVSYAMIHQPTLLNCSFLYTFTLLFTVSTSYLSHYLSKTRHACLPIVYTSTFFVFFSYSSSLLSLNYAFYSLIHGILLFSITAIHSNTFSHCITSFRLILYHHEQSTLSLSSCSSSYYSACFPHDSNSNYPLSTLRCC